MGTRLLIGDPHLRKGAPNREWCDEVIKLAKASGPFEFIVVMGDLFHTHETLNAQIYNLGLHLVERLTEATPGTVHLLVGNHDFIDNQQFCTEEHWLVAFNHIPRVKVHSSVEVSDSEKAVFIPYVPKGRWSELPIPAIPPNYQFYVHQEFRGGLLGPTVSSSDGDQYQLPNVVWSGHLHTPHTIPASARHGPIHYIGSGGQASRIDPRPGVVIIHPNGDYERIPLEGVPYTQPVTVSSLNELPDVPSKPGTKLSVKMAVDTPADLKSIRSSTKYRQLVAKGHSIELTVRKGGSGNGGGTAPSIPSGGVLQALSEKVAVDPLLSKLLDEILATIK